jgi:hypothetical protein
MQWMKVNKEKGKRCSERIVARHLNQPMRFQNREDFWTCFKHVSKERQEGSDLVWKTKPPPKLNDWKKFLGSSVGPVNSSTHWYIIWAVCSDSRVHWFNWIFLSMCFMRKCEVYGAVNYKLYLISTKSLCHFSPKGIGKQ